MGSFEVAHDDGGWNADLNQAKFLPIRMQAVGFGIERDAIDSVDLLQQLRQPGIGCNNIRHSDHRNPLKSNSVFVLVACRLSISFSIDSSGGSAAIVLRSISTRSHSSG